MKKPAELTEYFSKLKSKSSNPQDFAIEVLDLLHFLARARKDTVSELITETVIDLIESNKEEALDHVATPNFAARQVSQQSQKAAPEDRISPPEPVQPIHADVHEKSQQSSQESKPKPAPAQSQQAKPLQSRQPQQQPKKKFDSSEQYKEMLKFQKPVNNTRKLCYSDSEDEKSASNIAKESQEEDDDDDESKSEKSEKELKSTKQQGDDQNEKLNAKKGSETNMARPGDSDEDSDKHYYNEDDGDNEDDIDIDDEAILNKFGGEFGKGDMGGLPNTFFHDAKPSKKQTAVRKTYTFEKDQGEDMSVRVPEEKEANEDEQQAHSVELKERNHGKLIKIPKGHLGHKDKKKMKRLLEDVRGEYLEEGVNIDKELGKVLNTFITPGQLGKLKKTGAADNGGRNKNGKKEPRKKVGREKDDRKKGGQKERRKLDVNSKAYREPKDGAVFEKKILEDDEPEPALQEVRGEGGRKRGGRGGGITERAKMSGKYKSGREEHHIELNEQVFGTTDTPINSYQGLGKYNLNFSNPDASKSDGQVVGAAKKTGEGEVEYLKIEDVRKAYRYRYIKEYSKDFVEAMDYLDKQVMLGFDTEFVSKDSMLLATYLQISSLEQGYVINLQHSQHDPKFKERIFALFSNGLIKKIAFGVDNDVKALSRTFNNLMEFHGIVGLEKSLFTTESSSVLGLAAICRRFYGKPLDKGSQQTIASIQDLTDPKDLEYAALDALVPVALYEDLKSQIECNPGQDRLQLQDTFETSELEFALDPSVNQMKKLLSRTEFGVHFLDNMTYSEISKLVKEKKLILITSDKFIIASKDFPNKLIFYDTKTFKDGNPHL